MNWLNIIMTSKFFKKKTTFFVLVITLFTIAFSFLSIAINLLTLKIFGDNDFNADHGSIYISIQHETNPLALADSEQTLSDFEELIHSLHNLPFAYYEIYRQQLDFSHNEKSTDYYSSTTKELSSLNDQVLSIQISENVQDDFKLSVASGRKFLPEDFSLTKGQPISVLMGSEYAKLYSLGDTFSAYYLYSPFTFKIVGFVDSSCKISISVGSTTLDKYIIMPSFSFDDLPESDTEYVTQKIHLANRTSGIARTTEDNFVSGWRQIEQLLNNSDVGNYSWTSSSTEKSLLIMGYNIRVLIPLCGIASILTSMLGFLLAKKYLIFKPRRHPVLRTISISFVCISLSLFFSLLISNYFRIILGMVSSISLYLVILAMAFWVALTVIILRNNTSLRNS